MNDQKALHGLKSARLSGSSCHSPHLQRQKNRVTQSFAVPLGPLCLCTCPSLCLPVYMATSRLLVKSQLSGYLLSEAVPDFSRQMFFPLPGSHCIL